MKPISDRIKERMKVPKDVRDIIKTENRRMNDILDEFSYNYEGTDMWEDTKKIRKQDILDLQDDDEDPYEDLGHGVMSYFRMIEAMACCFFVFTILCMPLYYYYS